LRKRRVAIESKISVDSHPVLTRTKRLIVLVKLVVDVRTAILVRGAEY
jgi:hypothetical protein